MTDEREMNCPECGELIGEHKLYCPECGANLNNVTAEDVSSSTATDMIATYLLPTMAKGIGAVIGLGFAIIVFSIILWPVGVLYGCAAPQANGIIHSILLLAQKFAKWLPFPFPC